MSVAVMQSLSTTFLLDQRSWSVPHEQHKSDDDGPPTLEDSDEERPAQSDIWSAIQLQKKATAVANLLAAPYVPPLVRRPSSLLSQKSLDSCTESLGSETGSDDFSVIDDLDSCYTTKLDDEEEEEEQKFVHEKQAVADEAQVRAADMGVQPPRGKELTLVNYHCSIGRRSPPRSYPPPLPSISRRDGPCIHMRPHRRDGRLVVEAISVPSQNYLHAQRVDGRLRLSFIDTTYGDDEPGYDSDYAAEAATEITLEEEEEEEDTVESEEPGIKLSEEKEEEELEEHDCYKGIEEVDEKNCYEEEEEEDEVEVVDRGTVVEVKVSTQPQQQSGAMKVHRSSLVINKFVGGMPQSDTTECDQPKEKDGITSDQNKHNSTFPSTPSLRRSSPTTTTAAAAVVAASTLGVTTGGYSEHSNGVIWPSLGDHSSSLDNKLLFTSKRRNLEELLHNMRRCSQLRGPLFIWEPCCIATSS